LTSYSPSLTDTDRGLAHRHADRPFRGIAMIVGSTVFLACSDAIAKYLSRDLPAIEIAWMRFLVFVLIMLPVVLAPSSSNPMKSARPMLQVWRGLALVSSSIFFISGLRFLPIAEASATAFIAPIFVTGLSIALLGEKVGLRRWAATIAGLLGVMIIVKPGTSAFHPAAILPIISALGWACTLVLTRRISGADHTITTMAFSAIVGFLVLSVLVPYYWIMPTWNQILLGLCVGIASTTGQWIVALAFRYADASVLAPFSYSQLVWVTLLGFFIFGEVPDVWTLVGATVIIASGLYTAHRERMRRLQPALASEPYPSA
jgi:drug/metabolite transporter (DMT)-like permease